MPGAGAALPGPAGAVGQAPAGHVSPAARGEQRGAVLVSTQGFHQPVSYNGRSSLSLSAWRGKKRH